MSHGFQRKWLCFRTHNRRAGTTHVRNLSPDSYGVAGLVTRSSRDEQYFAGGLADFNSCIGVGAFQAIHMGQ